MGVQSDPGYTRTGATGFHPHLNGQLPESLASLCWHLTAPIPGIKMEGCTF